MYKKQRGLNMSFIEKNGTDFDKITQKNDLVFKQSICDICGTTKIDNIQYILVEKLKVLDFDSATTTNIANHLALLYKNILEKKPEKILSPKAVFSSDTLSKIEKMKKNFGYDIPYLAGYSYDGNTIYIDKILANETDEYLIYGLSLHEYVEKKVFSLFTSRDELYFKAHQMALRIEELFIASYKGDEYLDFYNKKMELFIEKCANKSEYRLPQDIDTTPYKDCGFEDYYFLNNDSLLINLTIPVFLKNLQDDYPQERTDEILSYCSALENIKICSGNFLGFNDYIAKNKLGQFGCISGDYFYKKQINETSFSIKESFVYYGHGIGFIEILIKPIHAKLKWTIGHRKLTFKDFQYQFNEFFKKPNLFDSSCLLELHETLIDLKEQLSFLLLKKISESLKPQNEEFISTSFAISYFYLSSKNNDLEKLYEISNQLCGEYQSAKTFDDFKKSGAKDIYINHGFTGSVYALDSYTLEKRTLSDLKMMNNFLYLISNIIPELNIYLQKTIKEAILLSDSKQYSVVKKHLRGLKNVRQKIDGIIFETYPENVNVSSLDASIYDKAFCTWEFEKYIRILKEQNKKINNLVSEFDTQLKHISDKKLNIFVKLLTSFSATSVFVDIFSHLSINVGLLLLLVPIVFFILGIFF